MQSLLFAFLTCGRPSLYYFLWGLLGALVGTLAMFVAMMMSAQPGAWILLLPPVCAVLAMIEGRQGRKHLKHLDED